MGIMRHTVEQIVITLHQAEVLVGQGVARIDAIRQIGIAEQTYDRWRKHCGGMSKGQLIVCVVKPIWTDGVLL